MYEQISVKKKPKSNAPMLVFLLVCIVAMAVAIGLFIWSWYYQLSYRNFVTDFSNSSYYAYRRQTLVVEQDGKTYALLKENILPFYSGVTARGSGRLRRAPDREPDMTLTFGDGAYMQLWTEPMKNDAGTVVDGLIIRYVNTDGESYTYDSAQLSISVLPIDQSENIPVINKVPHLPDE